MLKSKPCVGLEVQKKKSSGLAHVVLAHENGLVLDAVAVYHFIILSTSEVCALYPSGKCWCRHRTVAGIVDRRRAGDRMTFQAGVRMAFRVYASCGKWSVR